MPFHFKQLIVQNLLLRRKGESKMTSWDTFQHMKEQTKVHRITRFPPEFVLIQYEMEESTSQELKPYVLPSLPPLTLSSLPTTLIRQHSLNFTTFQQVEKNCKLQYTQKLKQIKSNPKTCLEYTNNQQHKMSCIIKNQPTTCIPKSVFSHDFT